MAGWNCQQSRCRLEWVTHQSSVTMDTYGHLFPNTDDGSELAEAEKALLA